MYSIIWRWKISAPAIPKYLSSPTLELFCNSWQPQSGPTQSRDCAVLGCDNNCWSTQHLACRLERSEREKRERERDNGVKTDGLTQILTHWRLCINDCQCPAFISKHLGTNLQPVSSASSLFDYWRQCCPPSHCHHRNTIHISGRIFLLMVNGCWLWTLLAHIPDGSLLEEVLLEP